MVYKLGALKRKVREPADVNVTLSSTIYNSDGSVYLNNDYVALLGRHREEIVYTTKPPEQRSLSNVCNHSTYTFSVSDTAERISWIPSLARTWKSRGVHSIPGNSKEAAFAAFEALAGPTRYDVLRTWGQGYINDAFYATRPDLTEISIPNFLLELRDIPSLWEQFIGKARSYSTVKRIAGGVLSGFYGVKPLLGDAGVLHNIIYEMHQRVIEWNRKVGTLFQERHRFGAINDKYSGTFTTGYAPNSIVWNGTRTGQVTAFITYRALAIQAMSEAETILRELLDTLGFELNPRITWDFIPFSFVADWFLPIGQWLERYKTDTLELPIIVVDGCLQYKETIKIEHYWQYANDGYFSSPPRSGTGSQEHTTFHRLPILPDSSATTAAGWRKNTRNQAIIATALGVVLSSKDLRLPKSVANLVPNFFYRPLF